MTFITTQRFFSSRYKVNLTWNLNPRYLDLISDAFPTELGLLTQERSSPVDIYARGDIKAHKPVSDC